MIRQKAMLEMRVRHVANDSFDTIIDLREIPLVRPHAL